MSNPTESYPVTKYPWRSLQVGEAFMAEYCARCFRPLIAQAEKATGRKFEVVGTQHKVRVKRTS